MLEKEKYVSTQLWQYGSDELFNAFSYMLDKVDTLYLAELCVKDHTNKIEFISKLEPYLLDKKLTNDWDGTTRYVVDEEEMVMQYKIKYCKEVLDLLIAYENSHEIGLFEFNSLFDIALYNKEELILYTVAHEDMLIYDRKNLDAFFQKK